MAVFVDGQAVFISCTVFEGDVVSADPTELDILLCREHGVHTPIWFDLDEWIAKTITAMWNENMRQYAPLMIDESTHLSIADKRFGCAPNRKKSKFEVDACSRQLTYGWRMSAYRGHFHDLPPSR